MIAYNVGMHFFRLLRQALRVWVRHEADQHAAALAYFTPFALTPLIIISISMIGYVFGADRLTDMLVRWGNGVDVGVTDLIYKSVQNFDIVTGYYYLPIVGGMFLSIMVFITLNSLIVGLHKLWDVELYGWRTFLRKSWRIALFIVVLQGYFIAVIMLGDTIAIAKSLTGLMVFWSFLSYVVSFVLTLTLLAVAYGVLALQSPTFNARFAGATVAGVLLFFSRELVTLHFSTAPVQSLFGAAGLLITLLVWVYVVAGIVLYGAAFARVYDEERTAKTKNPVITIQ